MKQFELRFLDRADSVVRTQVVVLQDDLDALSEAERRAGSYTVEIFDGVRKVARVKKGNASLNSRDRLGG
jgi:hypothetical protein